MRMDSWLGMWCPCVEEKLNIKKREPMSTTRLADFGKSILRRSGAGRAMARKCATGILPVSQCVENGPLSQSFTGKMPVARHNAPGGETQADS